MLDTVRVGVQVGGVGVADLVKRGWTGHAVTRPGGEYDTWAVVESARGVRLAYQGGYGWLSAEVSLPVLITGDNAGLLCWADCVQALDVVAAEASDALGVRLPEVAGWRVNRFDAVWAWPVEPSPYVAAMAWARLPRTLPVAYPGSVRWQTSAGSVRGRGYDKAAEVGHQVALPLRLERQARPRREVVRVSAGRLGCEVRDLSAGVVVEVLADIMHTIGVDSPIPGPLEARRRLTDTHGSRRGRNLYHVLREVQDFGGWPGDVSKRTRQRYERLLRQAGIASMSWAGELPALAMPPATCL